MAVETAASPSTKHPTRSALSRHIVLKRLTIATVAVAVEDNGAPFNDDVQVS
jgi:hypothetical protein